MKIAICEFHQETNSFNPFPSPLEDYLVFGLWEGEEMLKNGNGSSALDGMIHVLEENKVQIVPTCRMWANAAGPVEAQVVEDYWKNLSRRLKEALPLDGVCISLHGATQSTASQDVCGDLLEKIRQLVGPSTILSASLDLHANITEKMLKNAEFLCGYHTYPHVDFYETGSRAASLCLQRLKNPQKPLHTRCIHLPMIAPASSYTTLFGPFSELMRHAEHFVEEKKIADFSIFQRQPWLDVGVGGSAVLTVSESDSSKLLLELARRFLNLRHSFHSDIRSVQEIIHVAENNATGKPLVLVDSADSTNAGANGDSAYILHEILRLNSSVKAALSLRCAPAVRQAFQTGVGKTGTFTIGASINSSMSAPVTLQAYVQSLHDGIYTQEGPAKRGLVNHLGPTAVLKFRNTSILVSEQLLGAGDLQLYRHHGMEPLFYQMVAVKTCTSFRASYLPVASDIIEADTPGAASSNLLTLPFRNLPKRFYPFAEIDESDLTIPKRFR